MGMVELAGGGAEGPPFGEEDAVAGELLDAVVARVGHVDVAVVVDLDPMGSRELTCARAEGAPLELEVGRRPSRPGPAGKEHERESRSERSEERLHDISRERVGSQSSTRSARS